MRQSGGHSDRPASSLHSEGGATRTALPLSDLTNLSHAKPAPIAAQMYQMSGLTPAICSDEFCFGQYVSCHCFFYAGFGAFTEVWQ